MGGSQAEGSPFRKGKTQLGEILVTPIDDRDNRAALTLRIAFSVIDTCLDDQMHGALYGRLPFAKIGFGVLGQIGLQFYIRPVVQVDTCWP